MKNLIATFLISLMPMFALSNMAMAAGGNVHLEEVEINLNNKASLQRGAQLFVNYCLNCHAASYMRYSRMAKDIGLTDEQVVENMIFPADFSKEKDGKPKKSGQLMTVAMSDEDGKAYFGTAVPDLSVVARSRGADWIYTYLKSFYIDDSRPFGVNNTVFPSVGMPHVTWELEGLKKAVKKTTKVDGKEVTKIVGFETVVPGTMSAAEYDSAVTDLVNYLVYMGEPAKLVRYSMGVYVLGFLFLLFVVSYAMKKEFWKNVH